MYKLNLVIRPDGDLSEAVAEAIAKMLVIDPALFLHPKQVELQIDCKWWPKDCPGGVLMLAYPNRKDNSPEAAPWLYHGYPIGADRQAQVSSHKRLEGKVYFDLVDPE